MSHLLNLIKFYFALCLRHWETYSCLMIFIVIYSDTMTLCLSKTQLQTNKTSSCLKSHVGKNINLNKSFNTLNVPIYRRMNVYPAPILCADESYSEDFR